VVREIIDVAGCVKGWLTSSIAKYSPEFVPAELRDQARWLPMPASNEKGIRNFSDAANQTPYRARAWYFRKNKTNNPAATAKSVDCHK